MKYSREQRFNEFTSAVQIRFVVQSLISKALADLASAPHAAQTTLHYRWELSEAHAKKINANPDAAVSPASCSLHSVYSVLTKASASSRRDLVFHLVAKGSP